MGIVKFTNGAQSTLASSLSSGNTAGDTITLASGDGDLFPVLDAGDWHPLTVLSTDGQRAEILRVTARTGDALTVLRAREGTASQNFPSGSIVWLAETAAFYDEFVQNGDQDLVVERGVNFAVSPPASGDFYKVQVGEIAELRDQLKLEILPHRDNVGTNTRIQLNDLPITEVVLPDGSPLYSGAISSAKTAVFRYSETLGKFTLQNAIPKDTINASTTARGLAQQGTEADYDENGENTKFSTQRLVSRIVKDYFENEVGPRDTLYVPFSFRNAGNSTNTVIVANGATRAQNAADVAEFRDLTIEAGGTYVVGGRGVCLIRCSGKFTLEGTLRLARSSTVYPVPVIGPLGSFPSNRLTTPGLSTIILPPQRDPWTSFQTTGAHVNRALSIGSFRNAVIGGMPVTSFQGGAGAQYRGGNGSENLIGTDGVVASGGLVIVANEIEIKSGGRIEEMYPRPETTFGSGDPSTGPSGGGMVALFAETLPTVDPGATFEALEEGVFTGKGALLTNANANGTNVPGASPGQLFGMNVRTGAITRFF